MSSTPLQRTMDRYCAWHKLGRILTVFQAVLFSLLAASTVLILADRLFFLGIDCITVIMYGCALALLALLVYVLAIPRRPAEVSYAVDKQAGLKNLVGSAVSVEGSSDEASSVVTARAINHMESNSPAKLLPLRFHWTGRFMIIPALLFVASLFLPTIDVLGRKKKQDMAAEERAVVEQGAMKLAAKLTSIEQAPEISENVEAQAISQEFNALAKDMMGVSKKEALQKLGEFESKYRDQFLEQRDFTESAKALEVKADLAGLPEQSRKEMEKLLDALKEGDFSDTAKALRELAEQLKSSELSAEDKKALAEELKKVAEGMKGKGPADSLAKALEQMEASSADLQELMKQAEMTAEDLQDLASLCDSMGNMQAMKDALAEAKKAMLGDSFSDFNAMEVEEYLESQAQLGMGQGEGEGEGQGVGVDGYGQGGTGGEGQGRGGKPPEQATLTDYKNEMDPSKINKGRVLQQLFVSGVPDKGEALVKYTDEVNAAKQHAAGSLAREKIPREYEDLVKTYFDSLDSSSKKDEAPPEE